MKIKISNVEIGRYTVREALDKEQLKSIQDSLKADGQWDPIIVRKKDNGKYEVISGHYRLTASKNLGWTEIEASVMDVSDEEADILALKTNLIRKNMSEMEEAKIINKYIEKYGLTYEQISNKLGKSIRWVSDRVSLILHISNFVKKLLEEEKLTAWQCAKISSIQDLKEQDVFAKYLVENNIPSGRPTELALKRFKNQTIYTIGYQGKTLEQFIDILKNNQIENLIDIRYSAKSEKKPEFSDKILSKELERNGIKYENIPQLGVPFLIQNPYFEGFLKLECVEHWYRWYIQSDKDFDFKKFVERIKDTGKTALMCMETYPKPIRNQSHGCHRDLLANIIMEMKKENMSLFKGRIDL
jgi:ParB family chromosome partitioning protein